MPSAHGFGRSSRSRLEAVLVSLVRIDGSPVAWRAITSADASSLRATAASKAGAQSTSESLATGNGGS